MRIASSRSTWTRSSRWSQDWEPAETLIQRPAQLARKATLPRKRNPAEPHPPGKRLELCGESRHDARSLVALLQVRRLHDEPPRGPVGFQIHPCDHRISHQERQYVIAMLALGGRRIDLEPDAYPKQALRTFAPPDEI